MALVATMICLKTGGAGILIAATMRGLSCLRGGAALICPSTQTWRTCQAYNKRGMLDDATVFKDASYELRHPLLRCHAV